LLPCRASVHQPEGLSRYLGDTAVARVEMSALDSRIAGEMQLMTVLVNEIGAARVEPLALPLPADRRAPAAQVNVFPCAAF